jgi:hypothetical protein
MPRIVAWESGKKVTRETDDPADLPSGRAAALALTKWRERAVLSRAQTITGLVAAGYITALEGRASSSQVPAQVESAIVSAYPTVDEQEAARLKWLNFTEADRLDPLVAVLATIPSPSLTGEQLDAFFETYAQI